MEYLSLFSFSYLDLALLLIALTIFVLRRRSNDRLRVLNGDFRGKTVFVTGGTSGIGKELATRFSELGAKVIITGRDANKLKDVCKTINRCEGYVLDMENPDNVEQWCEKNAKSIGKLDVLIHNAGITMRELLMNTEIGIGQKLMNVHFLSVFALTKGLLKNMKTGGQGSVICGVGSIAGINGLGIRTMYSSMKGSMEGFFKSLASEVKSDNIHSMVIHLGYIQTNVAKNALVGDGSKTFGKTDPNIKKGLPVRECADRMIDSIVLRNSHEVWICNGMMMNIKMFLPKLFPWIGDYNLYHDLKKQLSGLKEAK